MRLNWLEKYTVQRMTSQGKTEAEALAHVQRVRAMPEYVDNTEEESIDNAADDSYFANRK